MHQDADRRRVEEKPRLEVPSIALLSIEGTTFELFSSLLQDIGKERLRSAGIINRALIECLADGNWIAKKPDRAQKYLDAVKEFHQYMTSVAPTLIADQPVNIKEKAGWTTSAVANRVEQLGPKAVFLYDYYSYFTHVSPAFYSMAIADPMLRRVAYSSLHHGLSSTLNISRLMCVASEVYSEAEALRIYAINEAFLQVPSTVDNL